MPRTQFFFGGLYAVRATVSSLFMCLVRPLISEFLGQTNLFHVPRRVLDAWIPNSGREERASSAEKMSDEKGAKLGYAPPKNDQISACLKLSRNFTPRNLVGSAWWAWKFAPKKIEK